jgi:hypothetical protein
MLRHHGGDPTIQRLARTFQLIAEGAAKHPKDKEIQSLGQRAATASKVLYGLLQEKRVLVAQFKSLNIHLHQTIPEYKDELRMLKASLYGRLGFYTNTQLADFGLRGRRNRKRAHELVLEEADKKK